MAIPYTRKHPDCNLQLIIFTSSIAVAVLFSTHKNCLLARISAVESKRILKDKTKVLKKDVQF